MYVLKFSILDQTVHVAAQYGQTAFLYHIITKYNAEFDAPDNSGRSPLHWYVKFYHIFLNYFLFIFCFSCHFFLDVIIFYCSFHDSSLNPRDYSVITCQTLSECLYSRFTIMETVKSYGTRLQADEGIAFNRILPELFVCRT